VARSPFEGRIAELPRERECLFDPWLAEAGVSGAELDRGMDALEVEIRNTKEVWVKFQDFQAGHAEKVPIA
jgi:hypothetical protein